VNAEKMVAASHLDQIERHMRPAKQLKT